MSKVRITDEIFQVGGGPLTAAEDAAVYLICVDGHAALVDAGCGGETDRLLANVRSCGVMPEQVEYLLLTHCHFDHAGGAADLAARLPCQVVAHEMDAEFLERGDNVVTAADWYDSVMQPVRVGRRLSGPREEILLGNRVVEAIHTPGHTPGSVVFLMESGGQKVLFGQDVHGPLAADFHSNREDYHRSLHRLISLGADILCEGHFGVYRGRKRVAEFIEQFLREF